MRDLQAIALHARVVENRLRAKFPDLHILIEIEVTPDGFLVKSVGGDEARTYQVSDTVRYDEEYPALRSAVDMVGRMMTDAIL